MMSMTVGDLRCILSDSMLPDKAKVSVQLDRFFKGDDDFDDDTPGVFVDKLYELKPVIDKDYVSGNPELTFYAGEEVR